MDTETGYDNTNIWFSCRGIGYGWIGRKYKDVSKGYNDKKNRQKKSTVFNWSVKQSWYTDTISIWNLTM